MNNEEQKGLVSVSNTGLAVNTSLKSLTIGNLGASIISNLDIAQHDISRKAVELAYISYKTKSLDVLGSLPPMSRAAALRQISLQAIEKEMLLCEEAAPERYVALHTVYQAELLQVVKKLTLHYFNSSDKGDAELDAVLLSVIQSDYAALSIAEIEAAFAASAKRGLKTYNVLNVSTLHAILGDYTRSRSAILVNVLDAEQKAANAARRAANADVMTAINYEQALNELQDLSMENKVHRSFHSCPHHFVERLVKDGQLTYSDEEKANLHKLAKSYLAYDLLGEAPKQVHRDRFNDMLKRIKVKPSHSGRSQTTAVYSKIYAANKYCYNTCSEKEFFDNVVIYYSKLLYFSALAPYTFSLDKK